MKKQFRNFSVLFAAAAMMASCSNDEPAGNQVPENVKGMDAYLSVNIQDAAGMLAGRADYNDGTPENGDYEYGTGDENAVSSAKFYFYTADGTFTQEGTLTNFTPSAGNNENIEVFGKKVLVLKGLTTNTTPTYMVTVLNAPADFNPGRNLTETQAALSAIRNGDNFVMSTTSFVDASFTDKYGTNKLTTDDFLVQPAGTVTPDDIFDQDNTKHAVEVYVERLAAKVEARIDLAASTVEGADNSGKLNADGYIELNVPVAGNDNNVGGEDATLSTVYVKISNWGLSSTAKTSYMLKNIDGLTDPFANWNKVDYHRSFWGKSTTYGQDLTADNANFITYAQAQGNFTDKNVAYCTENTNDLAHVAGTGTEANLTKNRNLTEIIFTAQVFEKEGTSYKPLAMYRYNGSLYRADWFKQFVLNYLDVNGKLNYYKKTAENKYEQMNATDLKIGFAQETGNTETGKVYVVSTLAPADNLTYCTKNSDGSFDATEKTFDQTAIDALNAALKSFDNKNGTAAYATAYTDGKMYYDVPIEHLVKRANSSDAIVEGNYGVVRNHWYVLTLNKVIRLGKGVFNPDGGEIILPPVEPEDPTYYLGAKINILSWKIVTQEIEI